MIGAVLGGIASGLLGKSSADKAAKAQIKIAKKQLKFSKKQFERQDELNAGLAEDQYRDTLSITRQGRATAGTERNALRGIAGDLRRVGVAGADRNLDLATGLAGRTYGRAAGEIRGARDASIGDITGARDASIAGFEPAMRRGGEADAAYGYNLGLGGGRKPAGYTGLEMSAGGKFLLGEGVEDVQGSAAGRGTLNSGATLEALERFRTGLVAQERDQQQAELFALGGRGQAAAGNIANLRTDAAGTVANIRTGAAGQLVGAGSDYADRMNGARTAHYGATYGAEADEANALRGAETGFADRSLGLGSQYLSGMGAARTNRANLTGNAAAQYGQNALTAMGNRGDAAAAGAIAGGNAWQNALQTGFGIAGYMGGGAGGGQWQNPFKFDGMGMPRQPVRVSGPMPRPF